MRQLPNTLVQTTCMPAVILHTVRPTSRLPLACLERTNFTAAGRRFNKPHFLASETHLTRQVPVLPRPQGVPQTEIHPPQHPRNFTLFAPAQVQGPHSVPLRQPPARSHRPPVPSPTGELPLIRKALLSAALRTVKVSSCLVGAEGGEYFASFSHSSSPTLLKKEKSKKKKKEKSAILNTTFSTVPFPK